MTPEEFIEEYRTNAQAIVDATINLCKTVKKIDTIDGDLGEEAEERLMVEMEIVSRRMKKKIDDASGGLD